RGCPRRPGPREKPARAAALRDPCAPLDDVPRPTYRTPPTDIPVCASLVRQIGHRMLDTQVRTVLTRSLAEVDPEIHAAVGAELKRQESTLEMIASENFAPLAVMQAQGSVLTNKYAEGYPGRRYYGGCEH